MKKNSLTTAVVAGIAGVAGFAGLASAVDLNPDGIGQVLVFPYYTVNKSQDTMLSVVNTTDIGKAVKVRFLEGYNSRECLDFNLFLSAYDVWTASVFDLGRTDDDSGFDTPDYDPYGDEIGPALLTRDQSCTIPYFVTGAGADGELDGDSYISFRPFAFGDTGPQGVSRCREGHFEMITMGDVVPDSDLDAEITHAQVVVGGQQQPGQGVPSCDPGYVSNANFAAVSADLDPPSGGIYGSAAVINVGQGTFFGYNADAVEGFYLNQGGNLYSSSGDTEPSLARAATEADGSATAYTFQGGNLITSNYGQGIDAVSAVFMAAAIYNQFEVNPAIGANTDWVVTFPTKKYYVDPDLVAAPVQPFVELFHSVAGGTDGQSCVQVDLSIYDREEASRRFIPGTCDISPCPPLPGPPVNSICRETNVLSFQGDSGISAVLGSHLVQNILPFGNAGHAIIGFDPAAQPHALAASTNGNVFHGLPATGFQASSLVNNGLTIDGTTNVLSNYSGLFRHRISRDCRDGAGAACS